MIVDEILYAERYFRDRYRSNTPETITLSEEYYAQLCEELGVSSLSTFKGMEVIVSDEVETFMLDEEDFAIDMEDEDYYEE